MDESPVEALRHLGGIDLPRIISIKITVFLREAHPGRSRSAFVAEQLSVDGDDDGGPLRAWVTVAA